MDPNLRTKHLSLSRSARSLPTRGWGQQYHDSEACCGRLHQHQVAQQAVKRTTHNPKGGSRLSFMVISIAIAKNNNGSSCTHKDWFLQLSPHDYTGVHCHFIICGEWGNDSGRELHHTNAWNFRETEYDHDGKHEYLEFLCGSTECREINGDFVWMDTGQYVRKRLPTIWTATNGRRKYGSR